MDSDTEQVNQPGPVERRLMSYGKIHPLVFGAFNDVNQGFEDLIKALADYGAAQLWRPMLARNMNEARGALFWKLRRTIGMAMHRANADLVLHRVPRVGGRTAAAEDRRALASKLFFEAGGLLTLPRPSAKLALGTIAFGGNVYPSPSYV